VVIPRMRLIVFIIVHYLRITQYFVINRRVFHSLFTFYHFHCRTHCCNSEYFHCPPWFFFHLSSDSAQTFRFLGLRIIEERESMKSWRCLRITKSPSHRGRLITFICSLHGCYNKIYSFYIWFTLDFWCYYCFFLLFNYDCGIDQDFGTFCFY